MLKATILNGDRQNCVLDISMQGAASSSSSQWILENEAVTFELTLEAESSDVLLNLYDHSIEPSDTIFLSDGNVRYIWKPKSRGRWNYECLFFNYFGIAELNVVYKDITGEVASLEFEPIEILASKSKAENVESMIMYLSSLGEDKLHSLFQTTKFGASFREGVGTPISYLERLEASLETLSYHIQQIIKKPLSKLSPKASIVQPLGDEQLDDRSISWLMDNLSVLEPVDNTHEAHLSYGDNFYRASSIEVTRVKEDSNIYENEVIYAAVLFMKQKASEQMDAYSGISSGVKNEPSFPFGYVSFFSQVSKLKAQLLGNQLNRCHTLLDKLSYLQLLLERNLPVKKVTIARPKLTSKAASNVSYRAVFGEFIQWLECNKPDWSLYRSLMAITSIPTLFELYTYYRLEETLQDLIYRDNSVSWNVDGCLVSLHYEPIYWMKGNINESNSHFINVEGKRVAKDGTIVNRKVTHKYAHRSPDYVIEINSQEFGKKLIVLDAKYTFASKAFLHYLPECTMKYLHGIALREGGRLPVESMTILYPDEVHGLESFHTEEYGINGQNPVIPSLQSLGVALGDLRHQDAMTPTIKRLLEISGVSLSNDR
ncbi:hypothetical protein [Vibrio splendidus]|uniref:hypothetical protein n=1 Tax=Vibrio splendidus TaxID=29497 RepID=UPI0006CA422F|nr:hypothetical protein [Vibrio splendidus]